MAKKRVWFKKIFIRPFFEKVENVAEIMNKIKKEISKLKYRQVRKLQSKGET